MKKWTMRQFLTHKFRPVFLRLHLVFLRAFLRALLQVFRLLVLNQVVFLLSNLLVPGPLQLLQQISPPTRAPCI
jgi:hypothetical protein